MDDQGTPTVCDENNGCVHHWMLDEKNNGVCKKCGTKKRFPSTWGQIVGWKSSKTKGKTKEA